MADEYRGYEEFTGTSEEINAYLENLDYSKWYTNEYLILHNTDDGKTTEQRFDGVKFVRLQLPPSSHVKAKNSLQRCALDLLLNKDITAVAILGGYGSGKSFLTMVMALYHIKKEAQTKIVGVREAIGEGKSVGFIPGDLKEKTGLFFAPLAQQLKDDMLDYDSLVNRGVIETYIPYYMKGMTFDDSILLVEEAEDLSESQIRLVGTRVGQNSRIFFSGDYKQSLICKNMNNPLVKMCYALRGNPMFGCITLDEDVRSETSKLFANLFQQ